MSRAGFDPIVMSHTSPSATNAICLPSGLMAGLMMPLAERRSLPSKLRRIFVYCARVTGSVAVNSTVLGAGPASARFLILPLAV